MASNAQDIVPHVALFDVAERYHSALVWSAEGRDSMARHMRELCARLASEMMVTRLLTEDADTVVIEVQSIRTGPTGRPCTRGFIETLWGDDGGIVEARVEVDLAAVSAIDGQG